MVVVVVAALGVVGVVGAVVVVVVAEQVNAPLLILRDIKCIEDPH